MSFFNCFYLLDVWVGMAIYFMVGLTYMERMNQERGMLMELPSHIHQF